MVKRWWYLSNTSRLASAMEIMPLKKTFRENMNTPSQCAKTYKLGEIVQRQPNEKPNAKNI